MMRQSSQQDAPCSSSTATMSAATSAGTASFGAWVRVAFWKKPLHLLDSSEHGQEQHHPHRHSPENATIASSSSDADSEIGDTDREMVRTLGLFDLIMIGIGGTVGSGVFATAGLIASAYAGPAAVLSWLIAGLGCVLSGFSFMELSCLIPSTGSTYAYAYHSLGELPAMFAGFLLTLEYGISSAGGARSWSDKFTNWLAMELQVQGPAWMKPADSTIDLYAGLLMALCVGVVLCGMQAGKTLVNVVTMTKISVVLFIIVAGFLHFDATNVTPLVPPATTNSAGHLVFGWPGVFLGASASFFGYIGYDEVCCLAGEAKDPTRTIPRAVIGTIVGAAALSTLATFALVGMMPYHEIDSGESFGKAFERAGWPWAATVVTTGEVLTMPITTFIGFLAQPRVQYAMAKDGLLPPVFARVDAHGNLFHGTLLCGVAITTIAVCVPFHVLWSFISLGILVAFNLTNASLLLVRGAEIADRVAARNSNSSHGNSHSVAMLGSHSQLIGAYLVASFVAAFHWQKSVIAFVPITANAADVSLLDAYMDAFGAPIAVLFTVIAVAIVIAIKYVEVAARRGEDNEPLMSASTATTKKKQRVSGASVEVVLSDVARPLQRLEGDHRAESGLRARTRSDSDESGGSELQSKPSAAPRDALSTIALDTDCAAARAGLTGSSSSEAPAATTTMMATTTATFRAPLVPFAPCVAIFFNWFLFAQMDASSVLLIALWLLLALGVYVCYSRHHSLAHQQTSYHRVDVQ